VNKMGYKEGVWFCWVLYLVAALGTVFASEYDHKYRANDPVTLWVNKVGPYNNPQETYNYYSLPFCQPAKNPTHKWGGLGEVLGGNELIDSQVDIKFGKNVEKSPICTIELDATKVKQFKEAIENVLNVKSFPTIAVQKKTGDKKKYIYEGVMNAEAITRFISDVDSGREKPKLKSDPEPSPGSEPVLTVVGTTLQREVFTQDKDVFLTVGAPWCGHCKKLEPEYTKLGQKIVKEGLTDLLKVTKIDGTTNDSPVDVMDWESFPTIYFVKAGQTKPIIYDGERTAKGLWKYVKKHATKAQEIRERVEKNKKGHDRAEEL